jgi:rRNA maturation endonuclease Nob1
MNKRSAIEEMKIASAIDPDKRIGNCEGGFPITDDACAICGATYADRCGRRATAIRAAGEK